MIYAVIDTNVLVSALITRNSGAATVLVVSSVVEGDITPVYNNEIIAEYDEVLRRPKFKLSDENVRALIDAIIARGVEASRIPYSDVMPDEKDRPFYEVSLGREDSFLVTGNLKHFPQTPLVITPAEMMEILNKAAL